MVAATPSSNAGPSSASNAASSSPANASIILGPQGKILCVADIRGDFRKLNEMVQETNAVAVIHTGDLGFMDGGSPARMAPRILRHVLAYTPLISNAERPGILALAGQNLFDQLHPDPTNPSSFILSQLGALLSGEIKLRVPLFCVYGPVEDVTVLEKFRTGEYEVENLFVLDEAITRLLEVGGLKLRLLGLGGAIMMHKMFDNGDATGTIAGGNGTVWATALQIGELLDTAQRVFDPSETRLFVTHGPIGKEGLLTQLALALKADLTISGSLHFRFHASFNEFGINSDEDSFKQKLAKSKAAFLEVYESAKPQLEKLLQADQKDYLSRALEVAQKVPPFDKPDEESWWKNCWNWNLSEANFGKLLLTVREGRVSAEMSSQGLNFGYRQHRKTASSAPLQRSGVTTATGPSQTPPPGHNAAFPAKAPLQRKASGALNAGGHTVPPKVIANNAPMGQAFSNARAPPPHLAHQAAKSAETATPPTGPAASNKASPSLPAKPQQQPRKASDNAGPQQGGRGDPRNKAPSGPAASQPAAVGAAPAAAPTDGDAASEGAQAGKKLKGKNAPNAPRAVNGTAGNPLPPQQQQQQPRGKENGPKQTNSKEKENTKPEPAETATPDNETASKAENGDEPVTKLPDVANGVPVGRTGPPPPAPKTLATLFVKALPPGTTEEDLRAFWNEDVRDKITKIKIPGMDQQGRNRHIAYVDFESEDDMKAGLEKHSGEINGQTVTPVISDPPRSLGRGPGGRGGGAGGGFRGPSGVGGGRGGRGGGMRGGKGPWNRDQGPASGGSTPAASTPAPAAPASAPAESW